MILDRLQLSQQKLQWLGQAAVGDLLVIETKLFNQAGCFSALQDTLTFRLYKQIEAADWLFLSFDYYYYQQLSPSLVASDYCLPISDNQTVGFIMDCLVTILDCTLCCVSSNLLAEDDPDLLVECYKVCPIDLYMDDP